MKDIDLYFGAFAKAMASIGGFIAGDHDIINYLRYNLRSQIYAKSLPMPLVEGNLKRLEGFRSEVCRAWRHALLRRSQRHRLSWDRFNRLARRHIPYCRQLHPYPEQRFVASRP